MYYTEILSTGSIWKNSFEKIHLWDPFEKISFVKPIWKISFAFVRPIWKIFQVQIKIYHQWKPFQDISIGCLVSLNIILLEFKLQIIVICSGVAED